MEQEQILIDKLIEKGIVTPDIISALLEEQQSRLKQAQEDLAGQIFAVNPWQRRLLVQDLLTGEKIREIDLSSGENSPALLPDADLSEQFSVALINTENGGAAGWSFWEPGPLYGLALNAEKAFLWSPVLTECEQLWLTRHCYCPYPTKYASDLFLSPDNSLLLIAERQSGTVKVLDTESLQILATVSIRPQGLQKVINIAFDAEGAWLTDNQSFMLFYLDLNNFQLKKYDIGLSGYALGNLAISPDQKHLFLLTVKPTGSLLYLDLKNFELLKEIPLKGELLSTSQRAIYDLFTLTPDQDYLLLMTGDQNSGDNAPLISVVDTHKVKISQRYQLKTLDTPALLVVSEANPLKACQKSVLELLLEENMISYHLLASLQVVDLDAPGAPDEGQGAVPSLKAQEAPLITLPKELVHPLFLNFLNDKIYLQTEIDLKQFPDSWELLEQSAEDARFFLETHDQTEVHLKDLLLPTSLNQILATRQLLLPEIAEAFSSHLKGLSILITRQEILSLIEQQRQTANATEAHPEQCPQCENALYSWDCQVCGYELENSERRRKKELSSLTPISYAFAGHLPLADPNRQRVLVLDQNRTLDWVLEADKLGEIQPWDLLWLPNKNLLILDRDNSQLHELGPSGQLKWTLPQDSPEAQLAFPVKVSYILQEGKELFLVVDQGNHRVLALDRQGQIHWQYGVQGIGSEEAGYLDMPFDLQWTHAQTALIVDSGNSRVLEIDLNNGQLLRSFGAELGLSGPVFAQRLSNDAYLIVDAGNYRVLELDSEGDPINECFYFRDDMGDNMRIDMPIRVIRGDRQNLILMDEEKIIELRPDKRRLIWSSLLKHLARRIEIINDTQETSERYTQSFFQYRMFNMDELVVRMRKRSQSDRAELNAKLMEKFSQLLEIKRELDSRRAERSRVKDYQRGPLLDVPIWILDRTHHLVMELNRKGQPIWYFGNDPSCRLQCPGQISETETSVLIADTGNQRILEVRKHNRQVILSIGGKTERILNQPRSATRTLNGNILVADQGNRRLVEFNAHGQVVWEFKNLVHLVSPYFAMEQGTGTILYADWALQMVKEIRRDGTLIWAYGQSRRVGSGPNQLSSPEFVLRLPSGSTLIADTHNDRVIEVTPNQQILWEYRGTEQKPLLKPCFCRRLADGHTLIASDNYRVLTEVDESGFLCWSFELGSQPLIKE